MRTEPPVGASTVRGHAAQVPGEFVRVGVRGDHACEHVHHGGIEAVEPAHDRRHYRGSGGGYFFEQRAEAGGVGVGAEEVVEEAFGCLVMAQHYYLTRRFGGKGAVS